MEISQRLLGLMFALSVAVGAGLGLLWNALKLLRALTGAETGHPPSEADGRTAAGKAGLPFPVRCCGLLRQALFFGADVLFGLTCGIAVILLLYYTNDGQFRLLALLGTAGGFFVWYHTLGRLLDRLTDLFVRLLRRLARIVGKLLLWLPMQLLRLWNAVIGQRLAACHQRRREKRRQNAARKRSERGLPSEPDQPRTKKRKTTRSRNEKRKAAEVVYERKTRL